MGYYNFPRKPFTGWADDLASLEGQIKRNLEGPPTDNPLRVRISLKNLTPVSLQ